MFSNKGFRSFQQFECVAYSLID